MKCSLGISNFLEEISSLSYSTVFLCFFALFTEERFPISPCYSSELLNSKYSILTLTSEEESYIHVCTYMWREYLWKKMLALMSLMGSSGQGSGAEGLSQGWERLHWLSFSALVYMCAQSFSQVWLFAIAWTIAHQASLSIGFSKQEYWSCCHFLPQGIFLTQGSNLHLFYLLHWQADSLPLAPPGKPLCISTFSKNRDQFREGNGNPLQYSCLENPMGRGDWWAALHGVAKSWTRLSDFTFTFHFHALEKEMATHSSILAWRIPGTAEPGELLSKGLHRVGHDWSDLAAAAEMNYYISCSYKQRQ